MPPIENKNPPIKPQITLNTNYFGTDGVVITENSSPTPKKFKFSLNIMIFVLIFLVIASVSYAYFYKIGLFSRPPYNEDNLMSGLISKFSDIKSASYKVSVDFYTKERDADAVPFVISSDIDVENNLKYSRDYKRSQDLNNILDKLKYYEYSALKYPTSLTIMKNAKIDFAGTGEVSIIDPLTNDEYKYALINDGKDFVLEIEFETGTAISEILDSNKYSNDLEKVIVSGKTAKFSKDSYAWINLSNRPPKSFFELMNEFSSEIPVDIKLNGEVSGASNWGNVEGPIDWKFNIAGQGDFGDLTYKVNVDLNKKDKNYFARINNFPSIMFFSQIPKNEWIKLNSESDDQSGSASFFPDINTIEQEITGSKDQMISFVKKFAILADEENLYAFREKPKSEKINGKALYKYDLTIKKDSVLPFYKKLLEELYKDEYSKINDLTATSELTDVLAYLETKKFDEIFDYFDKNSKNIIWVDNKGNPVMYEFIFRIVPTDENLALKGKQIMFTYKITLNDINVPVTVEQPESFKNLDDIMGSFFTDLSVDDSSQAVISTMWSIASQAEIFYEEYLAYGIKPFNLGECSASIDTLFAQPMIESKITLLKEQKSSIKCVSTAVSGKVKSYAISATLPDNSGYSYCVDSKGFSGEIFGELASVSCNNLE